MTPRNLLRYNKYNAKTSFLAFCVSCFGIYFFQELMFFLEMFLVICFSYFVFFLLRIVLIWHPFEYRLNQLDLFACARAVGRGSITINEVGQYDGTCIYNIYKNIRSQIPKIQKIQNMNYGNYR